MRKQMIVYNLTLDPITNMPVIILKDRDGDTRLPIWVGINEANAILLKLENIPSPRPMTHDLLKNVIYNLKATVEKIVVNDLVDNTFYAEIYLTINGKQTKIDARPSDAIALALRADAPIFVEDEVVRKSQVMADEGEWPDQEKLKNWLDKLKPEDFGKYEM